MMPAEPTPRKRDRRRYTRAVLGVRAKTTPARKLTRETMLRGWMEVGLEREQVDELLAARPRKRSECRGGARPCPWFGCRYHLGLEINPETGSIKLVFPDLEVDELEHTCALDVAEREHDLEELGKILNLTRERVRQVEVSALHKLHREARSRDIDEHDVVARPSGDEGGQLASVRRRRGGAL